MSSMARRASSRCAGGTVPQCTAAASTPASMARYSWRACLSLGMYRCT